MRGASAGALPLGPRAPFREKFRPPFRDDDDGLGLLAEPLPTSALSRRPEPYEEGMWDKPPLTPPAGNPSPDGQDSLPIRLVASMDRHACSWCENSPSAWLHPLASPTPPTVLPVGRHGCPKSSTTATA